MSTPADRQAQLQSQREQLRERLERLHLDRSRAQAPLDADFAEQAVQRENDEVVDAIEQSTQADLTQIDHALQRLATGLGDRCERCGAVIDAARLSALPAATRCAACA